MATTIAQAVYRRMVLRLRTQARRPKYGYTSAGVSRSDRRHSTHFKISTPRATPKLVKVAVGVGGVTALSAVYIVTHPQILGHVHGTKYWVLAEAVWRGVKLTKTVVLIVLDYKVPQYMAMLDGRRTDGLTKEVEVALAAAQREMRAAQDEYEESALAAERAAVNKANKRELKVLEARAREARDRVLLAAARLSKLEVQAQGLSESGRIHQKAAERLLELCESTDSSHKLRQGQDDTTSLGVSTGQSNGGAYIKVGQHLSQLDYLIPKEYTDTLKVLLNRAPVSSYEDVRAVVKEELGKDPEEIWPQFEKTPIASASLAQVHVAYDSDGRKMAVKVQHRGLRETSKGDITAMTYFINLIADHFPEFSYRWLAEEMAPQFPVELDFANEGRNADRAAAIFKHRDDVVVPEVMWRHTTPRVLTMGFEEGCCATDVSELKRRGLALDKVASLVSRVFCEQIFRTGYVHCDPHPANVLIRPHPKRKNEPQMVLLDHGLYKQLTDDFRLNYCRLWKALVMKDLEGVRRYCQELNSGELYTLLAAVLTNRSWDDIKNPDLGSLRAPNTSEDRTLIRSYAQKYLLEITDLLNKVPRQMLLLFKTNDSLRHIDRQLGSPVNTSLIVAEECIRALLREDLRKPGMWNTIKAYAGFLRVESRLQAYQVYLKMHAAFRRTAPLTAAQIV